MLRKSNELTYVKASHKSTVITIFLGVILRVLHFGNVSPVSSVQSWSFYTDVCSSSQVKHLWLNSLLLLCVAAGVCSYAEPQAKNRWMQLFSGGGGRSPKEHWTPRHAEGKTPHDESQHVWYSWKATGSYVLLACNMCYSLSHLPPLYFVTQKQVEK